MRHFELFIDRGTLWERVEKFRRTLSAEGMPPQKANSMGRSIDFAMLEISECARVHCGMRARKAQSPHSVGARDCVAGVSGGQPGSTSLRCQCPRCTSTTFYDQPEWANGYRVHLQDMLGGLGAKYIDASHWMPDESSFADPLHLTYDGAKQFSERLGAFLQKANQSQFN